MNVLATSVTTKPFVTMLTEIETIGGERVTKGTDRTPCVVIAAQEPLGLVTIGLMGAQIDHPADFEDLVNDAQDTGIAERSVADDVFDVEGRIDR